MIISDEWIPFVVNAQKRMEASTFTFLGLLIERRNRRKGNSNEIVFLRKEGNTQEEKISVHMISVSGLVAFPFLL